MITADSKPIYNGWGWDNYWTCNQWILWHEELEKEYGLQEANTIWRNHWFVPENDSWFPTDQSDLCATNRTFVKYFKSKGIDVSGPIADTLIDLRDTKDTFWDKFRDSIDKIFDILIIFIVLYFAFILWRLVKKNQLLKSKVS